MQVDEVLGVWRDHGTGERMVAVTWAKECATSEEQCAGGTWVSAAEFGLTDKPPVVPRGQCESDSESGEELLGGLVGSRNGETIDWHDNFGTGLIEGTEIVVQFVDDSGSKKVFRNYLGKLDGNYDTLCDSHQITYPIAVANENLGTKANTIEETHLMNLATLKVVVLEPSSAPVRTQAQAQAQAGEYFSWWIKAEAVALPFVQELTEAAVKKRPRRGGPNTSPKKRTRSAASSKSATKRVALSREIRNLMS